MADVVEIILALRNAKQFVSEADAASKSIKGVGTASEKTGKQAGSGWKSVAKWAGGAAAIYGATKFARGAVDATTDLAKSTLMVQRATNLDTQTASEWSALTKERGISAKQFQVSLVKLAKTMEASRTGTSKESATIKSLREQIDAVSAAGGKDAPKQIAKLSKSIATAEAQGVKARQTLAQLGVPLKAIESGDTATVLAHVANAMQQMKRPSERAALAQQLFGRSGQQLVPILMEGQKGIRKLLDEQKSYGNYLSGKSIKDTKSLIVQQREMDTAFQGVKVQLGTALLPILLQVSKVIVALARFLRPVTSNAKALKLVIAGVTIALIALKVATIAQAAAAGEVSMATKLWTIAQWALNAALDGNPIALVVIGIAALIAIIVVAYKKVGWFHRAVDDLWHALVHGAELVVSWLKANWLPILAGVIAGPFGIAAALIYKHFDKVKAGAQALVAAVKAAFNDLVGFVKSLPSKLVSPLKKIPVVGGVVSRATGIFQHLATGGRVTTPGGFVVGEKGPELVALPSGAAVTPITADTAHPTSGRSLQVVVPVVVSGREIARAVANVTSDQLARK